jgi:Na+/H+ antiporter NhaD/arsenite permease-like protein
MLAAGILNETEAFNAINLPPILLLYSLMVLSVQFTIGGFYTRVALSLTRFMEKPVRFLFMLMATSAVFSAFIVNDIVCLAFTPVVCVSLLMASLNPVPFLIGLACASNIGSAETINSAGYLIQCFEMKYARLQLDNDARNPVINRAATRVA